MSINELQEQIGLAILEQVRKGHIPAGKIVWGDLIEHQENITNNYEAGSNPVYYNGKIGAEEPQENTQKTPTADRDQTKDYSFFVRQDIVKPCMELIQTYIQGKSNPKDLMMPVRAAMDAGVICKPLYIQYRAIMPEATPRSKSSFNNYLRVGAVYPHPYGDSPAFVAMVEEFRKLTVL